MPLNKEPDSFMSSYLPSSQEGFIGYPMHRLLVKLSMTKFLCDLQQYHIWLSKLILYFSMSYLTILVINITNLKSMSGPTSEFPVSETEQQM